MAQQFPDEKLISLTNTPHLKHSLSGNYARGILDDGAHAWAVLHTAPEDPRRLDGLLTFGLLWLDRARESARRRAVAGLRLFFQPVPDASPRIACKRFRHPRWCSFTNMTFRTGGRGNWTRGTRATWIPG